MNNNYVLLLGAGFSKNWNGWLAEEVFDFLLSHPRMSDDPGLRKTLWDHMDSGFETAVEQVQQEAELDPESELKRARLEALQAAVGDMFDEMNAAFFQRSQFEFHHNRPGTVREFLTRFHAIFTLNQDLLLEHGYKDEFDLKLATPRRWDSLQIPGMERLSVEDPSFGHSWARAQWRPLPDALYRIEPRSQPFFKLHGSCNWVSSKASRLLVIGGAKEKRIEQHKILSRYALAFQEHLRRRNTRLVIIGYGFKDHHINRVIADSVFNFGLRFFVVAPKWREAMRSNGQPNFAVTAFGYDLEAVFAHGCVGASGRLLRETFGDDRAELGKLNRFIEPW